jgi:hypothetical protein
MKRIATTALVALLAAGTVQAQQPAARQTQRPPAQAPAQAQRPPAQAPRAAAPAVPTRVTARILTALCGQDRSACLTYVLGSIDAFAAALVAAGRPQAFCIPKGTTNDQIAQSAVAFLRAHPEEEGNNAALVILAAMRTRFPCGY